MSILQLHHNDAIINLRRVNDKGKFLISKSCKEDKKHNVHGNHNRELLVFPHAEGYSNMSDE
jgi:hypothetical protein